MTAMTVSRRTILGGIGATAAVARFAKAATPPAPLNFLVVGDWGRDGMQHQRDVAVQMGKAARDSDSRFVLSVGDNFYENGVQSAVDPQWKTSFEDVYTDPALQVPWHVALGNHDYRGNPQAQLDYAKISPRWRIPSRYRKVSGSTLGAPEIDLFIIDSSPLVHQYRDKVDSAIAKNVASQDVKSQLAWLDRELGGSTAPWKIVVGHHTVRSGGSGHGDTPEMVELIKPIMEHHGIQAYINGHDHDLQHIHDNGIDYLCCGAGSEVRPVKPVAGTKFCVARSGFASLTLAADQLAVRFVDYEGNSLYQTAIARRPAAVA